MNRNRGLVIAVVLLFLFGTITFAFADSEETYVGGNGNSSNNSNGSNGGNNNSFGNSIMGNDSTISDENDIINNEIYDEFGNLINNPMDNNIINGGGINGDQTINTGNEINNGSNLNNGTNVDNNTNIPEENPGGDNSNNNGDSGNVGSGTDNDSDNGGSNSGSGTDSDNSDNTGSDSNNGNGSDNTDPNLTPFIFVQNGIFNMTTIYIDPSIYPDFSYMKVYNTLTRKTTEVDGNIYEIDSTNTMYQFTIYFKDGTSQSYIMYHKDA